MSANAFGSDWAQLEAGTWEGQLAVSRPAGQGAPLHSPAARRRPIKGSLAQFNWRLADRNQEYAKFSVDGHLRQAHGPFSKEQVTFRERLPPVLQQMKLSGHPTQDHFYNMTRVETPTPDVRVPNEVHRHPQLKQYAERSVQRLGGSLTRTAVTSYTVDLAGFIAASEQDQY